MKKDNIRDYATEAFRFYAACGQMTSEQIKQKIYDDIYMKSKREYLRKGSGTNTSAVEYAVMKAEDVIKEMESEIRDILAVEKTLKRLTPYERKAVEIVYFTDPEEDWGKGEISNRVHKAEWSIPASERSIYGWLARARRIFAEERGLRTTKKNFGNVCSRRPRKSGNMVPSNPKDGKGNSDSAC